MADFTSNPLVDIIASYKKATKTALGWLSSQSCSPGKWSSNGKFENTREIIDCAEGLPEKYEVPQFVLTALRDAISARRKAGQMHKALNTNSSSTSSQDTDKTHEGFITRLEETLHILQSKKKHVQSPRSQIPQEAAQDNRSRNRFDLLSSTETTAEDMTEVEETSLMANVNTEAPAKPETETTDDSYTLQDDDLAGWFNDVEGLKYLNYTLFVLDENLNQSSRFWRAAANGTMPICVAAWLSSLAFHVVDKAYKTTNFDELFHAWAAYQMKGMISQFNIPRLPFERRRFTTPPRLTHYIEQLDETIRGRQKEYVSRNIIDFSKIITPLSQDDPTSIDDSLAAYAMLGDMRELFASTRAIADIEAAWRAHDRAQPICERLLPFVVEVLVNTELPFNVPLVFGLELLVSSFKAYTWPNDEMNRQNCRILVLQFAREVQRNISECIECIKKNPRSPSTAQLPSLLKVLNALGGYTKEVKFDLYHQAPWTAGCHMTEILSVGMYEGLYLCCHTGYLCALLHLYNAIRKIDPNFRRVRLMEQLCEIFIDKLFRGSFPEGNFQSCFRRAMGLGLDWSAKKGKKHQMGFSIPMPGLSEDQTHVNRFSKFLDIHTLGYEDPAEFWHMVYHDISRWQPFPRKELEAAGKRAGKQHLPMGMAKVKDSVMKEFQGDLPIARINYLAIFRFAVDLMEKFSNIFALIKRGQEYKPDKDLGFGLVDTTLVFFVKEFRYDKAEFMLSWAPVRYSTDLFNELDENLCIHKFLWKSVI